MITVITLALTLGLLFTLVYVGLPALIRWYTVRLKAARGRTTPYTQAVKVRRNPLPDMPTHKLTEEEKQRLTAWRVARGIRDNALSHYDKKESA